MRQLGDSVARLRAALADRYTIERELGCGGMAIVYRAGDVKHRRAVAIKVLRPELAARLGPDRFLREVKIAASLNHPHILALYDSGDAGGFLFYVMPYVEGETLRARLDREKQLPVEDALGLTRQVASALSYAHARNVVHRDIKPENILLHEGEAMVADFGIALAVSAAADERLTQTGIAVGTPAYMSPEQAASERAVDARSDVYSLGCVLYEMLAGEPPYTGPTVQALIAKRLVDPVPAVRRLRAAVPVGVDHALMKALAKVPADRWPSAVAFAEAPGPRRTTVGSPTCLRSRRTWRCISRPRSRRSFLRMRSRGCIGSPPAICTPTSSISRADSVTCDTPRRGVARGSSISSERSPRTRTTPRRTPPSPWPIRSLGKPEPCSRTRPTPEPETPARRRWTSKACSGKRTACSRSSKRSATSTGWVPRRSSSGRWR